MPIDGNAAPTDYRGWLVALHAGAGRFSAASESAHLEAMRHALELGRSRLLEADMEAAGAADSPTLATSVAADMLGVFERCELTNCGRGANLSEQGRVECEASVVCGRSKLLGACANVQGVESPSSLALALLAQAGGSTQLPPFVGREQGRQPPLVVVGEHAREMARQFGLKTADETSLERFQVSLA
jgi:taspase (threonine aspartase 1)